MGPETVFPIWVEMKRSSPQCTGIFEKGEWVNEWFSLTTFLRTVDIEVHIVYISCVIIAYTLESLSSLTQITHNLQATINFKKKGIKKEKQKGEGTHVSWDIIGEGDSKSVYK